MAEADTAFDGDESVTEIGAIRVGCSGWSYRDWRGRVYPEDLPSTRWFQHYTTLFDTVELNSTFYRLPTESTVDKWARAAPSGFLYAVKLGAFGSHRMKLRDPSLWLTRHVERLARLGASLGPTLVQLPPRWHRDTERLQEFLEHIPRGQRWAVELRDASWLCDDVYEVLARHDVALCIHDLLADHPFLLTTNWTYVRFHGPHAMSNPYRGAYGARRLRPWAVELDRLLSLGKDAYCYFNNDVNAHAVADAKRLRDALVSSAGPRLGPWPPAHAARPGV